MNYIKFDCLGGASGDMITGALLSIANCENEFRIALEEFMPNHFDFTVNKEVKNGISGISLNTSKMEHKHHHEHEHHHEHDHEHHHEHDHEHHHEHHHHEHHEHENEHHHEHDHHNFKTISQAIESSKLPDKVKKDAIGVFTLLAIAEGKVHNSPADEVKFHEVGAVDSIFDIVGACWLWHKLQLKGIELSAIPTGNGTVKCAHGIMPVPAPATAELIANCNLTIDTSCNELGEMLTPTGAALLGYWKNKYNFTPTNQNKIEAVANSFGKKTWTYRPNLLRALYVKSKATSTNDEHQIVEVACNIDDSTGEELSFLSNKLLDNGALDVWFENILMKKGRPAVKLAFLCTEENLNKLSDITLSSGRSFGLRYHDVNRIILDRKIITINTQYGSVDAKVGFYQNKAISVKLEFDQCVKIANSNNIELKLFMDEAKALALKELK